jgi:hypothetical protein
MPQSHKTVAQERPFLAEIQTWDFSPVSASPTCSFTVYQLLMPKIVCEL